MKIVTVLSAAFISVGAFADTGMTSGTMFLHVRPELSSFWRTADSNRIFLPVDLPAEATSASLHVVGVGYDKTYEDIPDGMFELELPAATSPDKENVYDLTLSFENDDTVRTAKIGVIENLQPVAGEVSARCRLSETGLTWRKTTSRTVVPVPYGMTSITVTKAGGEPSLVPLDGAQGWYALGSVVSGSAYSLELGAAEGFLSADVLVCNPGIVMVIR